VNESLPIIITVSDVMVYMIPIVAISGAFIAGIVAMILASKAKDRVHRERMFMAEKGIEIPRQLYGGGREKGPRDYRTSRVWLIVLGVLMIVIGIGVMITVGIQEGMREGVSGVIVIFIGIGFLLAERMIRRIVIGSNGPVD
jgi:hypothetical protein